MATNLWPNQWCEASGPVIGSVAADVDAPEHGGVFTLAVRDHAAGPRVLLAAGEQYLIQFVARRVSGVLALNAGVWLTQKSTSNSWQMGSCTKVADLPIGGGWALYERVQTVPADGTEGQLFFQIDQGLANGDPNGTHVWQVAGPLMWKRVADMAVKARDDVTLAALTDIANVRRYYLLQSSTLNPPAAPTANPAPSPWVTAEPTYSEGSTTSLYTVDLTVFTDGTFDYSTVSKSSSYEAAKSAYNKAVAAGTLADSKAKTFTSTPTVPYTLGDLWRNGNTVYICTTARTSGSYTASDWTLTADKTSENTAADTSKVGGTASATVIQNITTALANGKPFVQQATPSATAVGQLWFPLNASGNVIGMKVSTTTGTGGWQNYLMMAGQILVPGSVGTVSIGDSAITAPKITASDELWAKLASFAKVTTDMLIAGGAVITGDMIVDNLVGKNLYGAYIGGGELLIQGESAAPPTTGVITRFETSGDDELWANILTSTGVSRVAGGRSGYMLQSVAAPDSDGNVQNRVNTRYNNALSPWVSAINSIPLAGSTTLSVWVKSSVADTLSVIWFKWLNADGDSTLVKRDVDVAANTWTEVTLTGPAGYRPVIGLLGVLPLFTIFGTKVSSTQSRTLWVDDLTWSNKLATSSSLHLFRDASGTPTIQVTGGDSDSGVITLSAPTGAMAQLEFATADGTSSTKMTADGIAMTTVGRTDAASWTGVADTVSPILIKTTPKDIASGLYTDWFNIPYGQTFEEPPLLEGYLSPAGDIVKYRVIPYGATTSTFNLRVYNDGTQNKNGVVAWIIVRPVRSFKITNM